MKRENRYYRIVGGVALERHHSFITTRTEELEDRNALMKEFGASGTYGNNQGLEGLVFDDSPPAGWQPIKFAPKCFKPPRGKAGQLIRARLKGSKVSGASNYHATMVGPDGGFGFFDESPLSHGFAIRYITFEKLGDNLVLIVPDCADSEAWTPPEQCEQLKASEYWSLKEAAAEIEREAA